LLLNCRIFAGFCSKKIIGQISFADAALCGKLYSSHAAAIGCVLKVPLLAAKGFRFLGGGFQSSLLLGGRAELWKPFLFTNHWKK
jgi:hypothetical protein